MKTKKLTPILMESAGFYNKIALDSKTNKLIQYEDAKTYSGVNQELVLVDSFCMNMKRGVNKFAVLSGVYKGRWLIIKNYDDLDYKYATIIHPYLGLSGIRVKFKRSELKPIIARQKYIPEYAINNFVEEYNNGIVNMIEVEMEDDYTPVLVDGFVKIIN